MSWQNRIPAAIQIFRADSRQLAHDKILQCPNIFPDTENNQKSLKNICDTILVGHVLTEWSG